MKEKRGCPIFINKHHTKNGIYLRSMAVVQREISVTIAESKITHTTKNMKHRGPLTLKNSHTPNNLRIEGEKEHSVTSIPGWWQHT